MIGVIATIIGTSALAVDVLNKGNVTRQNRERALEAKKNNDGVVAYKDGEGNYRLLSTGEKVRQRFIACDNNPNGYTALTSLISGEELVDLTRLAFREVMKYLRTEAKAKGFYGYPRYGLLEGEREEHLLFGSRYINYSFDFENGYAYYVLKHTKRTWENPNWEEDEEYASIIFCKEMSMFLHPNWYSRDEIEKNKWSITYKYKDKDIVDKYDTSAVYTPEVKGTISRIIHEVMTQSW